LFELTDFSINGSIATSKAPSVEVKSSENATRCAFTTCCLVWWRGPANDHGFTASELANEQSEK
jgi:hypothetical protein